MRVSDEFGEGEIKSFLTDLAVEGNVAASTQDQAKSALLFLYQQVLNRELAFLNVSRSTKPQRLPVVLSRAEITKLLPEFSDIKRWDDVVFEFCEVSAVAGLERSFRPGRVKSNPQIRDFYAGQSLSGAGPRFSGNWNSWDNCSTLGDAVESHALLDSGDSVSG